MVRIMLIVAWLRNFSRVVSVLQCVLRIKYGENGADDGAPVAGYGGCWLASAQERKDCTYKVQKCDNRRK